MQFHHIDNLHNQVQWCHRCWMHMETVLKIKTSFDWYTVCKLRSILLQRWIKFILIELFWLIFNSWDPLTIYKLYNYATIHHSYLSLNSLHPEININILHSHFYTVHFYWYKKNLFNIQSFKGWQWFPLFPLSFNKWFNKITIRRIKMLVTLRVWRMNQDRHSTKEEYWNQHQ